MRKLKRPRDVNQLAKFIVDIATGQMTESDPYQGKDRQKVESGRLGGIKGGAERAKRLTATQRVRIAKKAAKTRWES
jgi:hypothetical protein